MSTKKVKILSIDGGGIRGILPGTILNYIETELQRRTNNPNTRLADHFDLIAGTSTGGILTCTYLIVDENGQTKYSAADALNIYLERGGDIFNLPFSRKLWSLFGIRRPKYSVASLENALHDYFGESMTADLKRPCIITSYDIRDRKAVFFNKVDDEQDNASANPASYCKVGIKIYSNIRFLDLNMLTRCISEAHSHLGFMFSPTIDLFFHESTEGIGWKKLKNNTVFGDVIGLIRA
jgi:patatin-like phospholipase/acyl hydrolase